MGNSYSHSTFCINAPGNEIILLHLVLYMLHLNLNLHVYWLHPIWSHRYRLCFITSFLPPDACQSKISGESQPFPVSSVEGGYVHQSPISYLDYLMHLIGNWNYISGTDPQIGLYGMLGFYSDRWKFYILAKW